ncbi:MAG: S9 family peptidase [Cyclobacteriaceae bacterium]|nr:S9 family peptidase [Cyclobacteriaceae bacterium]
MAQSTFYNFKIYILLIMSCISLALNAQSNLKILSHDDYDAWNNLANWDISNDGSYVYYVVNPQEGDGNLYLKTIKGELIRTIPRGQNAAFTYDSRFLISTLKISFEQDRLNKKNKKKSEDLPGDSLVIYSIYAEKIWEIPDVSGYKIPKKWSGWLACQLKTGIKDTSVVDSASTEKNENKVQSKMPDKKAKGKPLILKKLSDGREYIFDRITEYAFADEARMFYFLQEKGDSTESAGAYAFDISEEKLILLDSAHKHYKFITPERKGNALAFIASADSIGTKEPEYNLFLWNSETRKLNLLAKDEDKTKTIKLQISPHKSPEFSYDGTKLFAFFSVKDVKYEYEEDTTILDGDRVNLDIWSWTDGIIQPQQLKELEKEKKRSFISCFDLRKNYFTSLSEPELPDIITNREKSGNFILGISDLPYQIENTWVYPGYRDFHSINLTTGHKKRIVEKTKSYPGISPAGKYFYWYDYADSAWYVFNPVNERKINLTGDLKIPFYDELHDIPTEPGAYGVAVWTENDEHLLLYDKYDIWMFDPAGRQKPYCLTENEGRKQNITFRYQHLEENRGFVKPGEAIYLLAFDHLSKSSAIYRDSVKTGNVPQLLFSENASIHSLKRSAEYGKFIFRKGDFRNFHDLYASDGHFSEVQPISETNPQTSDFRWGQVKIVEWMSMARDSVQGLLYVPDDIEPGSKLPMIVYFYEKSSHTLHNHILPAPSRSIVNIPYYVSNGYIVFVPDIHYREGLPGQSAYDCIIPGVLKILSEGLVDEKRMALQGQSWGGYQTAWLITRTGMFRAAMAGAPVSNMTSAYGGIRWESGRSRMFQYERTQSRIGGSLWERPMLYIENSPLFYADRVNTPLLMMHNDADGAVPWYQGIEFFMALRRFHKPAWMLVYNGEAHNLGQRKNMKDLSIRMSQFFDYYLKNAPIPLWMQDGIPAVKKGRTLLYETAEE